MTLVELYDADQDTSAWLTNLSVRAEVGTGEDILIAGFVTNGDGNQRPLIRGIGPGLSGYGVGDALPDPDLAIYQGSEQIATNDNWSSDPAQAAQTATVAAQVGAFPLAAGSEDAGLLITLPAGAYTVHLQAHDGRAGVGMIEVYLAP